MLRAINVLPAARSYKPVGTLTAETNALAAYCRGAITLATNTGATVNLAADDTSIYSRTDNTWSVDTAGYLLSTENNWEFIDYSTNKVIIAANGQDKLQAAPYTGGFTPITLAPGAAHIATARNFVIAGNQATDKQLISWSALGDYTEWTPGTQQAGEQLLNEGGEIRAISGGEYAVIFMDSAIYRMTYTAPPIIWQFDLIMQGRGTMAPKSVVTVGHQRFFLDLDGFYVFDGGNIRSISNVKLSNWFLDRYDPNYAYKVTGAADYQNSLIWWAYPTRTSFMGLPNEILVYNWLTDRWAGPIQVDVELLTSSRTPPVISDAAGYPGTSLSDTIDLLSDASAWAGGNANLAAFNNLHQLATFSGTPMKALLESGEYAVNLGGRGFVTGVRPIIDGNATVSALMRVGGRNIPYGNVTFTALKALNTQTGLADVRSNNRYHRYQMEVEGEFEHIYGVETEYVRAGRK